MSQRDAILLSAAKIVELEALVKSLQAQIAELEARDAGEVHHHHHYHAAPNTGPRYLPPPVWCETRSAGTAL